MEVCSLVVLGSKDVKFSTKLETLAKDKGIKLTDEDYATMLKADNIIDPPKGFRGGGMASIDAPHKWNVKKLIHEKYDSGPSTI